MKKICQVLCIIGVLVFAGTTSIAWAADAVIAYQNVSPQENADAVSGGDNDFGDDLFDEFEEDTPVTSRVADPIYYFNYAMYTVNDKLYFYALKPLARGYKALVPTPARTGIRNFFHNLLFPVRFRHLMKSAYFLSIQPPAYSGSTRWPRNTWICTQIQKIWDRLWALITSQKDFIWCCRSSGLPPYGTPWAG